MRDIAARNIATPWRVRGAIVPFVLVSLVAMVCIGAGIAGLFIPAQFTSLARPAVAWSLLAVGVLMDVGAGVMLVANLRARRRAAVVDQN